MPAQLFVGVGGRPGDSDATLDFVLLMAAMALLAVVPAQMVVVHPPRKRRECGLWLRLAACYMVVGLMASIITAAALLGSTAVLPRAAQSAFSLAVVVVLFSPLLTTCAWENAPCRKSSMTSGGGGSAPNIAYKLVAPTETDLGPTDGDGRVGIRSGTSSRRGCAGQLPEFTTLEMIRTNGWSCWASGARAISPFSAQLLAAGMAAEPGPP